MHKCNSGQNQQRLPNSHNCSKRGWSYRCKDIAILRFSGFLSHRGSKSTHSHYFGYYIAGTTVCRVNDAAFFAAGNNDKSKARERTLTGNVFRWPLSTRSTDDHCWWLTVDEVTRVASNHHRDTIFSLGWVQPHVAVVHGRTVHHCQPSTINARFTSRSRLQIPLWIMHISLEIDINNEIILWTN